MDSVSKLWRIVEIDLLKKLVWEYPLLDLGAGSGETSAQIFPPDSITGIDLETPVIMQNPYKWFVKGDITKLGNHFDKEMFQTVLSNCVIEHIVELDKVLEGVHYVLKPNGMFIFTVPTPRFGVHLLLPYPFWARFRNKWLNHHNLLTSKEWQDKLRAKGFEPVYGKKYLSEYLLQVWDLLCLIQFIWKKITRQESLPFSVMWLRGLEKWGEKTCLLMGARKV